MAESESAQGNGNQMKDSKRKQNFSVYEIEVIIDNVKKKNGLNPVQINECCDPQKEQMLWEEISQAVNAVGTAKQTVTEVKDKWKNLHNIAKKEFEEFKREIKIIGGGRPTGQPAMLFLRGFQAIDRFPVFERTKCSDTREEKISLHVVFF